MHSCPIDKASNRQIIEKNTSWAFMEIVKKRHKKLIQKLRVNNENFNETFNQISYSIKVKAVTISKF